MVPVGQTGVINVSVSSHYREPDYNSEVTSQGLLGERVKILEEGELFTHIQQEDGYKSWISTDQLYIGKTHETNRGNMLRVRAHFLRIYQDPDFASPGLREAVLGSRLHVASSRDGWCEVILPDGTCGWAQTDGFGTFPSYSSENIIDLAHEFLGYQYVWGGRSPKGFDCSGFVQTVFGMVGVELPRDSWQQQRENIISYDWRDSEPADLLFFGKTPERVTHVGIALGKGRFIHASGWVRRNSLESRDNDYSRKHLDTFISVNRFRSEV